MRCDEPGCLASMTGGPDAIMLALCVKYGWLVTKAGNLYCPKHRKAHEAEGEHVASPSARTPETGR